MKNSLEKLFGYNPKSSQFPMRRSNTQAIAGAAQEPPRWNVLANTFQKICCSRDP